MAKQFFLYTTCLWRKYANKNRVSRPAYHFLINIEAESPSSCMLPPVFHRSLSYSLFIFEPMYICLLTSICSSSANLWRNGATLFVLIITKFRVMSIVLHPLNDISNMCAWRRVAHYCVCPQRPSNNERRPTSAKKKKNKSMKEGSERFHSLSRFVVTTSPRYMPPHKHQHLRRHFSGCRLVPL